METLFLEVGPLVVGADSARTGQGRVALLVKAAQRVQGDRAGVAVLAENGIITFEGVLATFLSGKVGIRVGLGART